MHSIKKQNLYWGMGGGVLCLVLLLAVFAPLFTSFSYSQLDLFSINASPSRVHLLGTDLLGRDILSRLLHGLRISLFIGLLSTLMQVVIGASLGILSGYFGGKLDTLISRTVDCVMCFPFILTAMAIATVIGPSLRNMIFIIAVLSWTDTERIIRASVMSLKGENFICFAKSIGFSDVFIIWKHILPGVFPMLIASITISMANSILIEASLSFLGLGVKDPMPSLGNILANAQNMRALQSYPWTWMPAGIFIIAIVLSINFIGEGFRIENSPKEEEREGVQDFYPDLELERGKVTLLLGESGSGKSVSTRAVLDLNPENLHVHGKILFEGKNLLEATKEERIKKRGKEIVLLFQEPLRAMDPLQPVGKQVEELLFLQGYLQKKKRKERVMELFQAVFLENPEMIFSSYPHELSGGMRQRVQIAMGLAVQPSIVIADEPTAAVDEELKKGILELLKTVCLNQHIALLLISHEITEMREIADYVFIMRKGEIVEKGDAKTIFTNPKHFYTKSLMHAVIRKESFKGRFYEDKGDE